MRRVLLAGAAALAAASPALAHHSFAMFDMSKRVAISGTVKDFQYTNPHSWLIVTTADPSGKTLDWGFEAEGPSTLLRRGIKPSSFKPGDKVTVHGIPMRDGRPAGSLVSVDFADGRPSLSLRDPRQAPPPGVALSNAR